MKVKDFFRFDRQLWKDYIKVTAPILFTNGLWGVNTAMQTAILGHMTAAAIAAKFRGVESVPPCRIHRGRRIFRGRGADRRGDRIWRYGSGKMLRETAAEAVLRNRYLLGDPAVLPADPRFLSLYDRQPETKAMANTFLIILSVVDVGMSYQMSTNTGIIRGGGDTMFVVKMDLISIWLIVLPLSFFMAFVVKASPAVVVCCLNADQLFKCVPAFLRCNSWKWIHRLTREPDDGGSENWKS